MEIRVETYSGYKADEYPARFWIGARKLDVIDIEDRWYDPSYNYFRVFTDDARRYILRMHTSQNTWEVMSVR
ncbi:MAG: hypothetical protein ACOC41_04730 [Chitinivibrionales bacterium]